MSQTIRISFKVKYTFHCRVVAEIDDANRQLSRLGMGDAALGEGAGLEKVKRLAAMHQQPPGMPQQGRLYIDHG